MIIGVAVLVALYPAAIDYAVKALDHEKVRPAMKILMSAAIPVVVAETLPVLKRHHRHFAGVDATSAALQRLGFMLWLRVVVGVIWTVISVVIWFVLPGVGQELAGRVTSAVACACVAIVVVEIACSGLAYIRSVEVFPKGE